MPKQSRPYTEIDTSVDIFYEIQLEKTLDDLHSLQFYGAILY